MISGYEKLNVWKLSHELALQTYEMTKKFPREERFGITAQLRRAALSIPTNLAEGNARRHPKEYLRYCDIARGSLAEVRYLLRFALDLTALSLEDYVELSAGYESAGRMLNALMQSIRNPRFRK